MEMALQFGSGGRGLSTPRAQFRSRCFSPLTEVTKPGRRERRAGVRGAARSSAAARLVRGCPPGIPARRRGLSEHGASTSPALRSQPKQPGLVSSVARLPSADLVASKAELLHLHLQALAADL